MTVIQTEADKEDLTLRIVADYGATPERLWELWEDPRKLERWWGPPTFPATFTRHEFRLGGESRYHMTGPAGETPRGWWRLQELEKPHSIRFANGLAGEDGEPMPGVEPMTCEVSFEELQSGARMTVLSRFRDNAQMEQLLGMGMAEGMSLAIGQIDALLGEPVSAA